MPRKLQLLVIAFSSILALAAVAQPKPHAISFGKWTSAKGDVAAAETKLFEMKVRGLFVDSRLKEFTTGLPHEVTDRFLSCNVGTASMIVCPTRQVAGPPWQWQGGGWLLVDHITGRLAVIPLPEVDRLSSKASW